MSIFVNGEDVITQNKSIELRASRYSKGIQNASGTTVIKGGGTDNVYSIINDRVEGGGWGSPTTPEGYSDIGSSLISLPIYIGATQSTANQLRIIKPGEMVGLVPRYVITSAPGSYTYMSSYLSTNDRAEVKKAIYVIQAPGGGGAGSGTWGNWPNESRRQAGGAGGGSGAFAVYMTKDIFDDRLNVLSMNGGSGGGIGVSGYKGSDIMIINNGGGVTVRGGSGGGFRNNVSGSASGGAGGYVSNTTSTTNGTLLASYSGRQGGNSNSTGGNSVYSASTIEGGINPNLWFGMKYGPSQDTKAIARFYSSAYSYSDASSHYAGTLYGNNDMGRGGTGAASLFYAGGNSIHKGTNSDGRGYRGSGGGGASSRSAAGDRLAGGPGGSGMVAILF